MSYRISAFIIAAGLAAVVLATGTEGNLSDNGLPDSLLPANIYPDSIHTGNVRADTNHSDTTQFGIKETDPDISTPTFFARIAYSHHCLKVVRDGKSLDIPEKHELLPGDILETCSRHFALIDFSPGGTMILYPASRVTMAPDGSELITKSGEFLFDNDLPETSFPDIVRCFEESLHHSHDAPPVSFGVHCRGESGMILTSKAGTLWWSCRDAPCQISAGQGLMGRITTANYSEVMTPAQPRMATAYVVPRRQEKELITEDDPKAAEKNLSDEKSGFSATIIWSRVDMADKYLVHIYQDTEERIHHVLTLHHNNQFTVDLPEAGQYAAKVMAVDFYGVSSEWSDPISFTAEHDEYVGEDGLDGLDAPSPNNSVQNETTLKNPDIDSLLPDNGNRHL